MSHPEWIDVPTSNIGLRKGVVPEAIILHHSGGYKQGDLNTLTKKRLFNIKAVSSDFLIDRDGTIYKLNPQLLTYYTWHAGRAKLPDDRKDVNRRTIGIEQCHAIVEGHWQCWPNVQIKACARLCRWLEASGYVSTHRILSHARVAVPRGRKTDPEEYPWEKFTDYYHEVE